MNIIKIAARVIISVGLLIYLISIADPQKIVHVFGNIWNNGGIFYIFVSIIFYLFALYFFALRWQVLVKGYGLNIATRDLFKFYLVGLFFNNFLPTAIGGDVMRIYNFIKKSGERTLGFASVMTERLFGIAGTLLLTLGSLIFMMEELYTPGIFLISLTLLMSIILFFLLIFNDRFILFLTKIVEPVKIFRLGERILKFMDA